MKSILLHMLLLLFLSTIPNVQASLLPFGLLGSSNNKVSLPYSLGVRDSLMIAHSFHNLAEFGPAGGLHGATYTVDITFSSSKLVPNTNWVIDIGYASTILSRVLSKYNYKNLDDLFGKNVCTTTEFMARQIFEDLREDLKRKGGVGFRGRVEVKLWESHKAWALYVGNI